jgi:hypothetical protein
MLDTHTHPDCQQCDVHRCVSNRATNMGQAGANWHTGDNFADFAANGYHAGTACCSCGGGSTYVEPPATESPVTAAPVTAAPVTAAPVTAPPTTKAPQTVGATSPPTTKAPVTAAPVTAAPVTAAPVTTSPVTTPTTKAPVTTAPTLAPTNVCHDLWADSSFVDKDGDTCATYEPSPGPNTHTHTHTHTHTVFIVDSERDCACTHARTRSLTDTRTHKCNPRAQLTVSRIFEPFTRSTRSAYLTSNT